MLALPLHTVSVGLISPMRGSAPHRPSPHSRVRASHSYVSHLYTPSLQARRRPRFSPLGLLAGMVRTGNNAPNTGLLFRSPLLHPSIASNRVRTPPSCTHPGSQERFLSVVFKLRPMSLSIETTNGKARVPSAANPESCPTNKPRGRASGLPLSGPRMTR